jgi:hypothetical protein
MGQAGNNFEIRNNVIVDSGVYGIFPQLGKNGIVEHNVVSGIADAAIYIGMSDNILVAHNEVFDSVAGIPRRPAQRQRYANMSSASKAIGWTSSSTSTGTPDRRSSSSTGAETHSSSRCLVLWMRMTRRGVDQPVAHAGPADFQRVDHLAHAGGAQFEARLGLGKQAQERRRQGHIDHRRFRGNSLLGHCGPTGPRPAFPPRR